MNKPTDPGADQEHSEQELLADDHVAAQPAVAGGFASRPFDRGEGLDPVEDGKALDAVEDAETPDSEKEKSGFAALLERFNHTRTMRSVAHFLQAPGVALAGGIAYSGLFSLFAALTLGMSIFMHTLGRNPELRTAVVESVDMYLPGILDTGDGSGLLSLDVLVDSTAQLTLTSVIAGVVLLFGASSFMSTLKKSLRVMFLLPTTINNPVMAKLIDFLGLFLLALAILSTAVGQIVVISAGDWLLELIGLQDLQVSDAILWSVTSGVVFIIDAVTLGMLYIFVAGARVSFWRNLLPAMLIGALGLGILRFGSSWIISDVSDNQLLAPIATLATLLLWLNFMAMVMLLAASWAANPPHPKDIHGEYKPAPLRQALRGKKSGAAYKRD